MLWGETPMSTGMSLFNNSSAARDKRMRINDRLIERERELKSLREDAKSHNKYRTQAIQPQR